MSRDRTARGATAVGVAGLVVGAATTLARSVPASWVPTPSDNWAILTSFTDFGVLAYLLGLASLAVAIVSRRSWARVGAAVLTVALTAVHVSWLVPWFTADPPPAGGAPGFRVSSLNMEFGEAEAAQVVAMNGDVDVVVLTEINGEARSRLLAAGLGRRFPYERAGSLAPTGNEGTTVFSRFPITRTQSLPEGIKHQNWNVTVAVPEVGAVQVVAVHPSRPVRGQSDWLGDQELLRDSLPTGPTVVAGDFNAVDNHLPIRRLAADGFRTATDISGAGWQPTYPADRRWLPPVVGIDHILLSPELTATTSTTVRIAGTDHLGVVATLARR